VTLPAHHDRVLLEVEDGVAGFRRERRRLFEPFEQRSADRTGLGLGLAISRWGAEANDGRIYARNLPGHGCVFTVDLPRSVVIVAPGENRDTVSGGVDSLAVS
jgi:signal transduction histidine kinase